MSASELKRCPFCGGKAKAYHWSDHTSEVICKNCGASFRFERSDDLEETVAAWNRRAGGRREMKNCDTKKRSDLPLPIAKIFEHWDWCRKHQKVCPLGPTLVKNADDRYHLCKPKHLCFTAWMMTDREAADGTKH